MRLVPFVEDRPIKLNVKVEVNMMNNVENPMVLDRLWAKREESPKVIAECAGCEADIYAGEDVYEFTPESGETVLIHQNLECCRHYISEMSRCLVAGER